MNGSAESILNQQPNPSKDATSDQADGSWLDGAVTLFGNKAKRYFISPIRQYITASSAVSEVLAGIIMLCGICSPHHDAVKATGCRSGVYSVCPCTGKCKSVGFLCSWGTEPRPAGIHKHAENLHAVCVTLLPTQLGSCFWRFLLVAPSGSKSCHCLPTFFFFSMPWAPSSFYVAIVLLMTYGNPTYIFPRLIMFAIGDTVYTPCFSAVFKYPLSSFFAPKPV